MAVTGLDGWADVTATLVAPTTSAGANRKQIYDIEYGNASGNVQLPTGVTIGGVTPTFEGGVALGTTQAGTAACQLSMNEVQLAAMSGSAIVVTGGSFSRRVISTRSIQDTAQTPSTNSNYYSSGATNVASGAVSLTRVANSFTVAQVHCMLLTTATMVDPARVTTFSTAGSRVSIGDSTDTARTVNVSFTGGGGSRCSLIAVNYAPFPTASITDINGSAFGAVKAGSTGNTVTTTASFTPTSGTHGGKSISAISGSAGSYTFTSAAYVDGATFSEPDTTQTFALTDGGSTPTASSVFASPDGMTSVVIASPITADSTYIGSVYTLANGDRWVYPTLGGDFFIDADGKINALNAGTYVCWHWRVSDGVMTQVTLNISEAGAIVSAGGLTSSGLTSPGFTSSGLTSTGL